jgi:hypothetical protein
MEILKKLPEILQQHYEKAVLGLALLGLVVSGLLLAGEKEAAQQDLQKYLKTTSGRKPTLYTNVNWTPYFAVLQQATNAVVVDFKTPRLHNVFGPVKWQERSDGRLLKIEVGNEVGAEALKVTKITPLYLIISINTNRSGGGSGFFTDVTREAATNAFLRKKYQSYVTPGIKDRFGTFVFKENKGTPENPELVLELTESGEKVTASRDQPYQRVDGYKVDFNYPPENKPFADKRLNETLTLGGEDYIIIAISQNEVVLSARSNNKRTTLRYNAAL